MKVTKQLTEDHIIRYFYQSKKLPLPLPLKRKKESTFLAELVRNGWKEKEIIKAIDFACKSKNFYSIYFIEDILYESVARAAEKIFNLAKEARFCFLYQSDFGLCAADQYGAKKEVCHHCQKNRDKWLP